MASPCIISYGGKDYSYDEFAAMLHDGLLNELSANGDISVKPQSKADRVIGILDNLKIDTKNTLGAFGIAPVVWNGAIDTLKAAIKAGVNISKAVDNFIKDLKSSGEKFNEQDVRDYIENEVQKNAEPTQLNPPKGMAVRRFNNQALNEFPELQSMMTEDGLYYTKMPNNVSVEQAKAIIDYFGDSAVEEFSNMDNSMPPAVRTALGQMLIKKMVADGDARKAVAILDTMAKAATNAAQMLQALSMYANLGPEGWLIKANKVVNEQAKRQKNRSKSKRSKIKDAITSANTQAAEAVVEKLAERIEQETTIQPTNSAQPKEYGENNKIVSKKRYNELKNKLKGKLFSNIDPDLVELAVFHVEASGRKFGDYAKNMIKDLGTKVKPYLNALYDRAKVQLSGQYNDFSTEDEIQEAFDNIIGPNVKKALKDQGVNINKIITEHFTLYDAAKEKLADKFVNQLGFTGPDARSLEAAVNREFDRLATEAKTKAIGKILGPSLNPKKDRALTEQLVQMSNMGVVSDADIMDAFTQKMGWPTLSANNIQQITDLANQISTAPPGIKQNRLLSQMNTMLANMNGIDWKSLPMAIWYANVLSGPMTQLVNIVSNITNSAFSFGISAAKNIKNPMMTPMMAKAWGNGFYKGLFEGWDVLKTGYTTSREQVEDLPILELLSKYNPVSYLKYVRRAMVAVDTVMYNASKEQRMWEWAAKTAMEEGTDITESIKKRAAAVLARTDTSTKDAVSKAESEYQQELTALKALNLPKSEFNKKDNQLRRDRRRRAYEIIEQNSREDVVYEAKDYAARTTYNFEPEGLLGLASRSIASFSRGFPPFKLIVPFTNVVANVANIAIDYTPWGFVRGFKGGSATGLGRKNWEELSPMQKNDVRNELVLKALLGTTSMFTLLALTGDDDDEKDPAKKSKIEITANGTGDYKKNAIIAEKTGWQPYSVRIGEKWYSYQYSPLIVVFALIGNYRDSEKYKDMPEKEKLERWALAALQTKNVFLDLTFLKGLNTFSQALFSSSDPDNMMEKASESLLGTAKGFVLPNFYTQMAKEVEKAYNMPIKEVRRTLLGSILKDIPVARDMYQNKVNLFGELITPDTDKFVSDVKHNDIVDLFIEKKYIPTMPSMTRTQILDPKTDEMRLMTEEEYFVFAKTRGQYLLKEMTIELQLLKGYTNEEFLNEIKAIEDEATAEGREKAEALSMR